MNIDFNLTLILVTIAHHQNISEYSGFWIYRKLITFLIHKCYVSIALL